MKCSPHDWKVPEVGDDALVCQTCGRELRLMDDLTDWLRGSILGARSRHYSDGERFRKALAKAYDDAARRRFPETRGKSILEAVHRPVSSLFDNSRESRAERIAELLRLSAKTK